MTRTPALAAVAMLLLLTAVDAQTQKPPASPSVAGTWTMMLETPHGKLATAFELKAEGKKITGVFTSEHTGKVAIIGEFADGRLTWKATEGELSFAGKLKDGDTLTGVFSTERGDLQGTATRARK